MVEWINIKFFIVKIIISFWETTICIWNKNRHYHFYQMISDIRIKSVGIASPLFHNIRRIQIRLFDSFVAGDTTNYLRLWVLINVCIKCLFGQSAVFTSHFRGLRHFFGYFRLDFLKKLIQIFQTHIIVVFFIFLMAYDQKFYKL